MISKSFLETLPFLEAKKCSGVQLSKVSNKRLVFLCEQCNFMELLNSYLRISSEKLYEIAWLTQKHQSLVEFVKSQ